MAALVGVRNELLLYAARMDHGEEALKNFSEGPWDMTVGPGKPDNVQFGELLRRLRRKAGLSRIEAATRLGISAEYLRLLEAGKRTPALGQMRNVLDVYGAAGGINEASPEGFRCDLVVFDPFNDEGADPKIVRFSSRIREARRGTVSDTYKIDEARHQATDEKPTEGRAAELGLVVNLLTRADDDTLRTVRRLLEGSAGLSAPRKSD